MTIHAGQLEHILGLVNGGKAQEGLAELDRLLQEYPGQLALLAMRAEALRLAGRVPEAIDAFRLAGERGAASRNWLAAGLLLAGYRKTDEALKCLLNALEGNADNPEVLDA